MLGSRNEGRKLLSDNNDSRSSTYCNVSSSSNESDNEHEPRSIVRKRRQLSLRANLRRRILRLLICSLLAPIIFLVLYLPLNNDFQSRNYVLPDWSYNTSRHTADYVLPNNDTTLLEPRNSCHNKSFLVIMVLSGLDNFAQRQTIRETWGNTTEFNYGMFSQIHAHLHGQYLNPTKERVQYYSDFLNPGQNVTTISNTIPVRVLFLVGRSKYEAIIGNETITRLHNEHEQYDDIIQEDFIDTYNNLTVKAVLALKWVTRHCLQQTAYFMKCDDDSFVNVPNLIHFLLGGTVPLYKDTFTYYDLQTFQVLDPSNRLNFTRSYMVGHAFCNSRPLANIYSKWYMPKNMYPKDIYPRYLSGSGYVMSIDVVPRLFEGALNTSLVYLEDVYITGLVAEKMKIKRRHHPLFSFQRGKEQCSFKGMITQHQVKDHIMNAYMFVTNVSSKCPPPEKYFIRGHLRKNHGCTY